LILTQTAKPRKSAAGHIAIK